MPTVAAPSSRQVGESALYYPLVGVVVGIMLAFVAWMLASADTGLAAFLLLALWVWISGGLHLDGLADVADAWVGGMGDGDQILAILKDSRSGPAAITATVLLLLGKFSALAAILAMDGSIWWLLPAPVFGRSAMLFLLLTTPYVRNGGMGSEMAANLPKPSAWLVLGLLTLLASLMLPGWWIPLSATAVFLVLFRNKILLQPGGVTGDFLGAACELVELLCLIAIALNPMF